MKDSKKTDSSGTHLWLVLMKAFQALAAATGRQMRESGLGESDFRVLEVLLHKGAMPVNAIGPKVFLTPGSISVAVERLHERGLVSRTNCPMDRRVRTVDLTAKGRKLITCVFAKHSQHIEELMAVLTPEERAALAESLKKLGKHAAELEKA